jgi:glutamate carboxypeptidase
MLNKGFDNMNLEDLLAKINAYQPEMLETLEILVKHESPSTEKSALDSFAGRISERFSSLGGEVTLLANTTNGDHAEVHFKAPQARSDRPGLILCHYDTVWPLGTIQERPFRIDDDKAYGPGVYDMKASLVMFEYALRAMADFGAQLPRPIVLLVNSDEEIGSWTSRELIERHAGQAEYVLVLEPPTFEGALKTARKGVGNFLLKVKGVAAHAGSQPERGVSAITEIAHQILEVQDLVDEDKGTTINVGIVSGGSRSNVIAAQAIAEIDGRAWTPQEAERIDRAIKNLKPVIPGAELQIEGGFERPPMMRSEAILDLFHKAQKIGMGLGLELEEGSTGGGSDGNFTAALGVPTLDGLGAMGDGAHADYEHILISHLPQRTALLAALLLEL